MAFKYNRAAPWEINPETGQWEQMQGDGDGWTPRRTADGDSWAQVDLSTPKNQALLGQRLIELMGYNPNDKRVNGDDSVSVFNPQTGQYETGVGTSLGNEAPLGLAGGDVLTYLRQPKEANQLTQFIEPLAYMGVMAAGGNLIGNGINALSGLGGVPSGGFGSDAIGMTPFPGASSGGIFSGVQNALSSIPNPFGSIGSAAGSTNMADGGIWDTVKSLAGPASNIIGGLLGANAASDASDAQIRAGQDSNALQLAMFNQNRADQEPWRQAGVGALNQLSSGIQPGGSLVKPFSMADYQADPGYNFRLSEGLKAVERSAAARGNLLSGGALKGITRYGQDMASNEYQNAYNRYNQDQANQYNRLAGVAGTGQTAVQQLGQAGQNYANQAGNTLQGIGNARASGYVGSANALSGGLAGAYNTYQSGQFLNSLMNRPSYGGMTVVGGSPSFGGAFQDDY